ncbi:barstar family protein [Clostridium intestinale]|uniref:Barstar family protein n=1 Tax=Clostridium intestinale TaxID=36845 RepID=A0A7D6ZRB0_9CLOT|nr:barstar family protein [Clostridium intestinale]QLY77853.1 barstar family protein [Clostridium intestinale]
MEFIKGYKEILSDYGYWPSFHDDYIIKFTIDGSSIDMIIRMESIPKGYNEYSVLFTFEEVNDFELKGELLGTASIIFDLEFKKSDFLVCTINSSMGTCGYIEAKEILVQKLIVKIDLTDIKDSKTLHKTLSKYLSFPKFYGMNWDAFRDAITGLVVMPKFIAFVGWSSFDQNNRQDADMLKKLLKEYKEENEPDFHVEYL